MDYSRLAIINEVLERYGIEPLDEESLEEICSNVYENDGNPDLLESFETVMERIEASGKVVD